MCELSHLPFDDPRLSNYSVRASSLYYFIALRCFGESGTGVSGGETSEEGKRDRPSTTESDSAMTGEDSASHQARLKGNNKLDYPLDVVEVRWQHTLVKACAYASMRADEYQVHSAEPWRPASVCGQVSFHALSLSSEVPGWLTPNDLPAPLCQLFTQSLLSGGVGWS